MTDLQRVILKCAHEDESFRQELLSALKQELGQRRLASSGCLKKYYDCMIGPKKTWESPRSGKKVRFWTMMKHDPEFNAKYTQKAKTWWENQQKREKKDPRRMKFREVSNTLDTHEKEILEMIRLLESGKGKIKDVRSKSVNLKRDLGTLSQQAKRLTKGVRRERALARVDRLSGHLDVMSTMSTRKEAPKLKGRKRSN